MKNVVKFLIVLMILLMGCDKLQENIEWQPLTAFPDNHFFPSYAWATSSWVELPTEGFIGIQGGSIGITIKNDKDDANYSIQISAPEIAFETKYDFKFPSESTTDWFNVYPNINFKWDKLKSTTQPTPANVSFTLYKNGESCGQKNVTVVVHSIYDCPFYLKRTDSTEVSLDWMYAAYVNENDPVIDKLLREALNTGIVNSFTSYFGSSSQDIANNVFRQVTALWAVLYNRGITYSTVTTPSVGINEQKLLAQKVRFPSDALSTSQANCIDGTVLFASLLRRIGISSRIVLVPGHAFVGYNDAGPMDTTNYRYLETTLLGLKFDESQVNPNDIIYYRNNLATQVYSINKEAIYNFLNCWYTGWNEFNEAKPYIDAGYLGYLCVDVDKVRNELNILPISR